MSKIKNYYHDEICDAASLREGELPPQVTRSNGGFLYDDKHYYLTNGSFYYYKAASSHLERLLEKTIIATLREFINQENANAEPRIINGAESS